MSDRITIPAYRLDRATAAVGMLHQRHVRACARENQPIPAAPELRVLRRYVAAICNACHARSDISVEHRTDGSTSTRADNAGIPVGLRDECADCGRGTLTRREMVEVEVEAAPPIVGTWEFLAVVEPMVGGNLMRKVPGARTHPYELATYRDAKIACDHCGTTRDRKETFLIRSWAIKDGAGAEQPTYKMVGRSCLASFLPGQSYTWAVASADLPTLVDERATGESETSFWLGGRPVWTPAEIVGWTAAVVRLDGWTAKGKATEEHRATAATVANLLDSPAPGSTTYAAWKRARDHYRPNDEDVRFAGDAILWIGAKHRPDLEDYLYNLAIACAQACVEAPKIGLVASLVAAYGNEIGRSMQRRDSGIAPANEHVGTIGERITITGCVLERVHTFPGNEYGPRHLHAFRDPQGRAIVWVTSKIHGRAGDTFTLTGTVAEHGQFRDSAQTKMTRCKLAT